MNTTADDHNELRYAEYVLGVLDADARAAVAHEIETSNEAATAIALWQRRLVPLAESIADIAPAPYVWVRIREALQLDAPARARPSTGLWENLRLWRWIGIGASFAAAALVVVVTLPHLTRSPVVESAGYMASTIKQDDGVTGWTAAMDLRHARMVVVPATPAAIAQGRATELWLIPQGGKPISVGLIALDKPTTLTLDPSLLARLGPTAALAVSVEPTGGSPTGQPTGPVVAKGAISAAPDAGNRSGRV